MGTVGSGGLPAQAGLIAGALYSLFYGNQAGRTEAGRTEAGSTKEEKIGGRRSAGLGRVGFTPLLGEKGGRHGTVCGHFAGGGPKQSVP